MASSSLESYIRKVEKALESIEAIREAINQKGVDVPESVPIKEYARLILQIGGGSLTLSGKAWDNTVFSDLLSLGLIKEFTHYITSDINPIDSVDIIKSASPAPISTMSVSDNAWTLYDKLIIYSIGTEVSRLSDALSVDLPFTLKYANLSDTEEFLDSVSTFLTDLRLFVDNDRVDVVKYSDSVELLLVPKEDA